MIAGLFKPDNKQSKCKQQNPSTAGQVKQLKIHTAHQQTQQSQVKQMETNGTILPLTFWCFLVQR